MAKVTAAQTHTLISYFLKVYKDKYSGSTPRDLNKFRDKWGFQSMLEQYGMDRAKAVVDYYFDTIRPGHPVTYFLYNYEKLNGIMTDKEKDAEIRKQLRADSEKRVKEWRGE